MEERFRRARDLTDHDVPTWHDGNLVGFSLSGPLVGKARPNLEILADLYPAIGPSFPRFRFKIIAKRVVDLQFRGNVTRLLKESDNGNIRIHYLDFTKETEKLIVVLFGGYLEVEAEKLFISDQVHKELQKIRK